MGKHGKYKKKYNKEWEQEPEFKNWLEKTSQTLQNLGQAEAYCKVCKCCLRPQKADLKEHAKTAKHRQNMSAVPTVRSNKQSTLMTHGFKVKSAESKINDLKLSAHVACHSSIRTIDHLGELLKSLGGGSKLADLRLHRTKCSKIICKVMAPAMLKELVEDIGDGWYSLIIDECTDNTALKVMGVMVRYYSFKRKKMVVDKLGIIETPRATHDVLYEALIAFLLKVGLKPNRIFALGTDGGLNLCGSNHSVFALLRKNDNPNLHLIKCICHGLDTSASKASGAIPGSVEYLLRESRNWFSHSALRKFEYEELYKSITEGNSPPQLIKMGATRWLSWYGAVKAHAAQYDQLKTLFRNVALKDPKMDCPMSHKLASLHDDGTHALYLAFLNPVLKELASINVTFQSAVADISVAYSELKRLVFTIAKWFIKDEALKQTQSGMLRLTELQALQTALLREENLKPVELVEFKGKFWETAAKYKIQDERLATVQRNCRDFLFRLLQDMVKRLPSCIAAVEKMGAFTPSVALGDKGRPKFRDLPLDLVRDDRIDKEAMEMQWDKLGSFKLEQLCPGEKDAKNIDIIEFWTAVSELKTGAGQPAFPDLSRFVLTALTLPLSNALVERLFSLLGIVKTKVRNRIGLEMLEAILRVRIHLQSLGVCCHTFEPTDDMVNNFNSKVMYAPKKKVSHSDREQAESEEEDDPEEIIPEAPGQIPIGLTLEDGDLDADDLAAIPEWDEMLNLVAEVDAMMDGNLLL